MIVNKTISFYKLRQRKRPDVEFATVQPIRNAIVQLTIEISALQKRLNKSLLPSFDTRERRMRGIEDQRCTINDTIRGIEIEIKRIALPERRMVISMQAYFFAMLKRIVMLYRSIQQESLRKDEAYSEYAPSETVYEEGCLLQMAAGKTAQIRQSIFNLTNTLLELKIALKSQSTMIDRIDFYFDKSNFYLEEANKEIEKIPANFAGIKDTIIYILIYAICLLLALSLAKIARSGSRQWHGMHFPRSKIQSRMAPILTQQRMDYLHQQRLPVDQVAY